VAPDGRSLTAEVSVEAGAAVDRRQLVLTSSAGTLRNLTAGVLVGPAPALTSITPIIATVGSGFTLNLSGSNLKNVSEVRFEPADGITVDSTPVWSVDTNGVEHVAVAVLLAADAAPGARAVVVVTPYGSSSAQPSAANTFTVFKPSIALNQHLSAPPTRVVSARPAGESCRESRLFLPVPHQLSGAAGEVPPLLAPSRGAVATRLASWLPDSAPVSRLAVAGEGTRGDEGAAASAPGHPPRGYRGPPEAGPGVPVI